MQRTTREVMLLAAWHIERDADRMRDCCADDGVWGDSGAQQEYEQAMAIVSALRREAGVTEPAEPEPEVITPIDQGVDCYDPAKIVPEPLHTVFVVWRPLCDEDVLEVDKAYRRFDGSWVLESIDRDMFIEPLAWTPKPWIPKWVRDKR